MTEQFPFVPLRNTVDAVVQGALIGAVLAFITFQMLTQPYVTKITP